MHILCTICSDVVNHTENIYVTKCGHIFHHHCLAQWIERSKSCPQCRNRVTDKCMYRLYPTISCDISVDDAVTLQSRLDDAKLQLRQANAACHEKDDKLAALNTDLKRNEDLIRSYDKKLVTRDAAIMVLKEQLECWKVQCKETVRLQEENETLQKNLQTLHGLQRVLNATADDVEKMLQGYTDVKTIAIFATALKRALCESETKKNETRDRLHYVKQQLSAELNNVLNLQAKLTQVEGMLADVQSKYAAAKKKRNYSEMVEKSTGEDVPMKQSRNSRSFDLNTAVLGDSNSCNTSVSSMVKRIENADSPYLSLKQSCLALSAMVANDAGVSDRGPNNSPDKKPGPTEGAFLSLARSRSLHSQSENRPLSIFYKKPQMKVESTELNTKSSSLDLSYDGMGGHSKLDKFPKPQLKLKSSVPKLTAKHKLKRPALPSGSQDIGKLMEKMSQ